MALQSYTTRSTEVKAEHSLNTAKKLTVPTLSLADNPLHWKTQLRCPRTDTYWTEERIYLFILFYCKVGNVSLHKYSKIYMFLIWLMYSVLIYQNYNCH